MNTNEPRPAGAFIQKGQRWEQYKCDHYRNLLEEVLDMLHGGVGDQALSDYLISAANYLQLELVRMEDLYK